MFQRGVANQPLWQRLLAGAARTHMKLWLFALGVVLLRRDVRVGETCGRVDYQDERVCFVLSVISTR